MGNNNKIIKSEISFFDFLKIYIAGATKKLITKRFNEYVPITERKLKKLILSERLQTIKFQGKPVNIFPLKYSTNPNKSEKRKNALIIFFKLKI